MRSNTSVAASWRLAWGSVRLLLLGSICGPTLVAAQGGPAFGEPRALFATRAELELALTEADQNANSEAYSAAFRDSKRTEANLIRARLLEGDFQAGDQLNLTVIGDSAFSGPQVVGPGPVLSMGSLPDIPLRGVLRSELESYLREQLGRYIRNAEVKVRASLRLTFIGGVVKPGFYQVDADMLLTDAIMQTGGISGNTDLARSKVYREGVEIVSSEVFGRALSGGRTLDNLNLRAGDEIRVGEKKATNWFTTFRTLAFIPATILSFYGLGKLVGIF
jgi:protein involved in polysaccharide export with SLBB domain